MRPSERDRIVRFASLADAANVTAAVGGKMRAWGLAALIALVALVAGCGGNSTPVAVTISSTTTGATTNSITLLQSTSAQFVATVSGASSNVVFWQVCMPFTATAQNPSPTNCTQGVGVSQCTNIPKVSTPLTGFGTITINGLYTAPPAPTTPNTFLIVATSCVDTTKFGTFNVTIDSGIRVKITPASATVGENETYQFTATVTGTQNTAVSWQVCTSGTNGTLSDCAATGNPGGNISPSGLFTAPTSTQSATIEAISAADQNQTATATVSVVTETAPTLSTTTPPIDPTKTAQGAVQQDVYLSGTGFISTTNVIVNGQTLPTTDFVLLSGDLIRVTIPGSFLTNAGPIQVGVQDQQGNNPSTATLNVDPVRPALVSATPQSVSDSTTASATVVLTGGFFSATAPTTATFNGQPVSATVTSSRQLSIATPSGDIAVPGLYPITVQNPGLPVGTPSLAALNLGVTPVASQIGGSAINPPIGVGSSPSAVAIDEADGFALVANTNSNSVSIINLATKAVTQVAVGNKPTGIAVDDLLPSPVALVVDSADQKVLAIDIRAGVTFGTPLSVALGPATPPILPFSIGINPITHRAIVAYQSTNQADILDLSTGSPVLVQTIAGTPTTSFGTGTNPAIAIDPQLNWALVTPGGSGSVNIVDLGVAANGVTGWTTTRSPRVVANISISTTAQGVGLDSQTHEAFVSDPQAGTLTTFSLLDFSVTSVMQGAAIFNTKGFGAAAVNSLDSVGVSVSGSTPGASAVIVNLQNGTVLQTVGGFAGNSNLTAVAVDPITNEAVATDQANGTAYIIPLGPALKPLQITEASHPIVFGGPDPASVTLTINGSGFVAGSEVLLDGTPLSTGDVSFVNTRQIIAVIPGGNGSLLTQPRRFALQIENPDMSVSNVSGIGVVQAVPVGASPVGVAIDTDRDLAIVTNSVDGTVSLIALTTQTPVGPTQTTAGSIGVITGAGAITVGTTPEGVASLPRLGLALVANNGSNNATIVDVTQTKSPQTVALCGSSCTGPIGVAMDQDTATGYIADSNVTNDPTSTGIVSTVDMTSGAAGTTDSIDHNPVDLAVDPNPFFPYLAVATDSSTSIIDFLDTSTGGSLISRTSGVSNPTGIIFDPVNQVFLVADSTVNEIDLIDPTTFQLTPVRVGIGPTSLDYNYQASTLVTANTVSGTMSVLSYVCPPSPAAPACLGPQVSAVLSLGGNQTTAPALGAASIAVDPILNLAVLVDEDNNQVLLVPLPN
jgi:YVTN family beta-propeller protein